MKRTITATVLALFVAVATVQGSDSPETCITKDQKMDAIEIAIMEDYGREVYSSLSLFSKGGKPDEFVVTFYPEGEYCRANVKISETCDVEGEVACKPYREG